MNPGKVCYNLTELCYRRKQPLTKGRLSTAVDVLGSTNEAEGFQHAYSILNLE